MTRSASSDAVEVHEDPLADRDADSEGEGDSGGEQADVPELERQALERELANGLPDDDDVVVKTAAYVPADWQPAAPKTNLGEKDFSDVDNPGAWHEFAYRPKFEGKGAARKYVGHAMPAGAMPVPLGEGGTRELAGWLFNYDGWEARWCGSCDCGLGGSLGVCAGASQARAFRCARRSPGQPGKEDEL
jgi:hypothetical protein